MQTSKNMTRMFPIMAMMLLPFSTLANPVHTAPALNNGLVFTENVGQVKDQHNVPRTDIDFKLETTGLSVFAGNGQLHYQWHATSDNAGSATVQFYRMDVTLSGANIKAPIITTEGLAAYETHFVQGNIAKTAHQYGKITYQNVYPQIDWVLYVQNNSLKYDFVVHPGGNPKDIQLRFEGAASLALQEGALKAVTPMGSIAEQAPYSYISDTKEAVASKYILQGNTLGFDVTAPTTGTLVIDPTVAWSTYIGSSDYDDAEIMLDKLGNVYAYGNVAAAANIATTGAFQTSFQSNATFNSSYVIKFNNAGQRQWGTYVNYCSILGGTVDNNGDIYVGGQCDTGWKLATPGTFQTTHGFAGTGYDGFFMKMTAAGTLTWATLYGGGAGQDKVLDIKCDQANNVYILGYTNSNDIIAGTAGTFMPNNNSSERGFLAQFNSSTGQRTWGTFVGGAHGHEDVSTMFIDKWNMIYISGSSQNTLSVATPGSFQPAYGGGFTDGFILKFNNSGQRIWSTYYGSTGEERVDDIIADTLGNVYVVGVTNSADVYFATASCYQGTRSGMSDGFISRFDSSGTRTWSTYYGGSSDDGASAIRLMADGKLLVGGITASTNAMATTGCYQSANGGSFDIYVAIFDNTGNRTYSTYFGGTASESAPHVETDGNRAVYLGGITGSSNAIATTGSFTPTYQGGLSDGFVTKFDGDTILSVHNVATVKTNALSVYPNPNSGSFTVKAATTEASIKLEVINAVGQVIYTTQLQGLNGKVQSTISLPQVPAGVYILRMGSEATRISIQ